MEKRSENMFIGQCNVNQFEILEFNNSYPSHCLKLEVLIRIQY